jgi:hypothetical protein
MCTTFGLYFVPQQTPPKGDGADEIWCAELGWTGREKLARWLS